MKWIDKREEMKYRKLFKFLKCLEDPKSPKDSEEDDECAPDTPKGPEFFFQIIILLNQLAKILP